MEGAMSNPLQPQLVYFFGAGQAEAGSDLKHLVGGKGASLADMSRAGLNVPPGFTISAACCELYYRAGRHWPEGLEEAVRLALGRLEQLAGRTLGQGDDPLLVAVRSGAAQSMPGMMDTILNVGLNPACVAAVARRTGNGRAAWQAYRHFLTLFGHTVGRVEQNLFNDIISGFLQEAGKASEDELDGGQFEELCGRLRAAYRQHTGRDVPDDPWDMLCQAINAVFDSWNNERAVAYRRLHRVEGLLGTAVNVQMMCPSEVSGVLFTANPVHPDRNEIIIEASYGLGESIVLGQVQPDRFVVGKEDLTIRERSIGAKERMVPALPQAKLTDCNRWVSSLNDEQIIELARLGLRVEAHFGVPCDIEWGLSRGQFYLLQSRPIKYPSGERKSPEKSSGDLRPPLGEGPSDEAERERVRREEIAALAALAEPGGTVWARFNLAEVLPEPTPMTWAIVRRFMSGRGGFGLMYRDLGFDPDPALDEVGIFDLVCGRPYCNLSREPRMQYRQLPFEHPFAVLKADPRKAIYPQPVFNPHRAGWRFWLLLPVLFFKLVRSAGRLRRLSRTFADVFRTVHVPAFVEETRREAERDYAKLDTAALLDRLEHWIKRTLYDFARHSLKPTALAGIALGDVERALTQLQLAPEQVQAALRELTMGVRPDPEADLNAALRELASGRLDRQGFLERFGHRGHQEMELAQPRWAEEPAAVERLVRDDNERRGLSPLDEIARRGQAPPLAEILDRLPVPAAFRPALEKKLKTLHTYLSLRETAKHHLLRGYALIRRVLVELDRRFELKGGVFFLTPDELPYLQTPGTREELLALIARRQRRRELALSLPVPQVLFSDDLEAIGRPTEVASEDALQGVPLSAGTAEAPALVLRQPVADGLPEDGYILVCPSTDPAWYPLFLKARGLVMETGGVLSHGAIAARELGLPAVAGLPEVVRRVRTGQRLRVNGSTGQVNLLV
jgi:phosphohistidine swiveling domain-containing protein